LIRSSAIPNSSGFGNGATAAEFVFRFSEPAIGNSLTEHLSYDGEVLKQRVEAPATFRPVLGGASEKRSCKTSISQVYVLT